MNNTEDEKNKQLEEMKAQLKAELLAEMKSNPQPVQAANSEYNYDKYRIDVTKDDMRKTQEFIDRKEGYGGIPIVGGFIFSYQSQLGLSSLDRGIMRKSYTRAGMRLFFVNFLLALVGAFSLLTISTIVISVKLTAKKALVLAQEDFSQNKE